MVFIKSNPDRFILFFVSLFSFIYLFSFLSAISLIFGSNLEYNNINNYFIKNIITINWRGSIPNLCFITSLLYLFLFFS